MDIFYSLNLIDFAVRIALVGMVLLIFLKLHKMDNEIIKSIIYLNFNKVRNALNYVVISSPFFLAASLLEYPGFRSIFGEEIVHLIQDLSLLFFQIGVIYFLVVVYETLNIPRH